MSALFLQITRHFARMSIFAHCVGGWLICAGALCSAAEVNAGHEQSVHFEVDASSVAEMPSLVVEVECNQTVRRIELQRAKNSSKLTGEVVCSPPVFLLPLRVIIPASSGDAERELLNEINPLFADENRMFWVACAGDPVSLMRTSSPGSIKQIRKKQCQQKVLSGAWMIVLLALVLWGSYRAIRRNQTGQAEALSSTNRRIATIDFLLWLVLAVLWTWPAAIAGPSLWVGRNFDLFGTVWVLDAAPRLLGGLQDILSGWPEGANYRRLDSFLLLPVGLLFQWVHPARVCGALTVLGVALTGWATQLVARAMGSRRPWDLLAGVVFALSGLMASALLEGQTYYALNPWLPLFLLCWWRACAPEGRARDSLFASLMFCLCLLTSGYMGVVAALVAVGIFAGACVRQRSLPWRAASITAGVALPVVMMVGALTLGGEPLTRDTSPAAMRFASANLSNMLAVTPEHDRAFHSMALVICPISLALLLCSPFLLRHRPRWRRVAWSGAAGLLLAMGAELCVSPDVPLFALPARLIIGTPLEVVLRFPMRMAWCWTLCAGLVGALALSALARSSRLLATILLMLAIVHAFVFVGMPARQRMMPTPFVILPGTLSPKHRVLNLYPPKSDRCDAETQQWLSCISRAVQIESGCAIADNALEPDASIAPRAVLTRWLFEAMRERRDADQTRTQLLRMGFDVIFFHEYLFEPGERGEVQEWLTSVAKSNPVSLYSAPTVLFFNLYGASRVMPAVEQRMATYSEIQATLDNPSGEEPIANRYQPVPGLTCRPAVLVTWSVYLTLAAAGLFSISRRGSAKQ